MLWNGIFGIEACSAPALQGSALQGHAGSNRHRPSTAASKACCTLQVEHWTHGRRLQATATYFVTLDIQALFTAGIATFAELLAESAEAGTFAVGSLTCPLSWPHRLLAQKPALQPAAQICLDVQQ